MEHITVTDEWLYRYMPVVDAAIIQELENRANTDYKFSREFKRKMRHLIKKEAHPVPEVMYNISKRAAVFFVCMISAALMFTMSVEAYRTKFFETIITYLEDSVLLSYFTDKNVIELARREPAYIPEGYTETDRTENEIYLSITYENNEGELVIWEQMLITDGGSMVLDSEYDAKDTKVIHGNNAIVFLYDNGYKSGYYEYEESSYMVVAEALSTEDIYRMFDSILK